ncbi:MAG: peptide/nickel transport system ATP-binding protein [Gaiellaceae bacterium]|nr:peptide/nickel transport system ATP-binding protein [Gaiellaceae bacterium]
MVFQDPYSSLNPRHTVGTIVAAPFRIQRANPSSGIKAAVSELLELVGLTPEHSNGFRRSPPADNASESASHAPSHSARN